jgi:hypothetical protein
VYLCSTPPYLIQTATDRRMHDYTELAMKGEVATARAVHASLDPVRRALQTTRPPGKAAAHQKYWQELLGQAGGPVRRPLLNLTPAEKAATRAAFEACGLGAGAVPRPLAPNPGSALSFHSPIHGEPAMRSSQSVEILRHVRLAWLAGLLVLAPPRVRRHLTVTNTSNGGAGSCARRSAKRRRRHDRLQPGPAGHHRAQQPVVIRATRADADDQRAWRIAADPGRGHGVTVLVVQPLLGPGGPSRPRSPA